MRPTRTNLSVNNLSKRGVPKQFQGCTVDDLDDFGSEERGKVLEFIKEYILNIPSNFDNNVGLFLFGSNGVGKSFIASLIDFTSLFI